VGEERISFKTKKFLWFEFVPPAIERPAPLPWQKLRVILLLLELVRLIPEAVLNLAWLLTSAAWALDSRRMP